jgi:hypothetical protein
MYSKEYLNAHFAYFPANGLLFRKDKTGKVSLKPVGSPTDKGHLVVRFKSKTAYVHRIVWAMHYEWPTDGMMIDHIDRDPGNNRIENLRLATGSQNRANSGLQRNSTSGYVGVSAFRNRFMSRVHKEGKSLFLGCFDTALEAALAYDKMATDLYGEFATTNASLGLL